MWYRRPFSYIRAYVAKVDYAVSCLIKAAVKVYQYGIGPWIGTVCRFQPSCSEYAMDALRAHNSVYAIFLIIRRLARCHPWGGSGLDPIRKVKELKTCKPKL